MSKRYLLTGWCLPLFYAVRNFFLTFGKDLCGCDEYYLSAHAELAILYQPPFAEIKMQSKPFYLKESHGKLNGANVLICITHVVVNVEVQEHSPWQSPQLCFQGDSKNARSFVESDQEIFHFHDEQASGKVNCPIETKPCPSTLLYNRASLQECIIDWGKIPPLSLLW